MRFVVFRLAVHGRAEVGQGLAVPALEEIDFAELIVGFGIARILRQQIIVVSSRLRHHDGLITAS